jgi:hypothetical protein
MQKNAVLIGACTLLSPSLSYIIPNANRHPIAYNAKNNANNTVMNKLKYIISFPIFLLLQQIYVIEQDKKKSSVETPDILTIACYMKK